MSSGRRSLGHSSSPGEDSKDNRELFLQHCQMQQVDQQQQEEDQEQKPSSQQDSQQPLDEATLKGRKREPSCAKCKNHGIYILKRGHNKKCEYERCKCPKCQLINERREVLRLQVRSQRQYKRKNMSPESPVASTANAAGDASDVILSEDYLDSSSDEPPTKVSRSKAVYKARMPVVASSASATVTSSSSASMKSSNLTSSMPTNNNCSVIVTNASTTKVPSYPLPPQGMFNETMAALKRLEWYLASGQPQIYFTDQVYQFALLKKCNNNVPQLLKELVAVNSELSSAFGSAQQQMTAPYSRSGQHSAYMTPMKPMASVPPIPPLFTSCSSHVPSSGGPQYWTMKPVRTTLPSLNPRVPNSTISHDIGDN